MGTQPRLSIPRIHIRLLAASEIVMSKLREDRHGEWEFINWTCKEFCYNELTMKRCVQCAENYPCNFPNSKPFQCDACSQMIFSDKILTPLEACFNLSEFLSLYTYESKLHYCREKIDWYTDGIYDKQRTLLKLNNDECMKIADDDSLDVGADYWALSPVVLQFTQNTLPIICSRKVSSLYFKDNMNHFGNWEENMALPIPCYIRFDEQNNRPCSAKVDSARIFELLQPGRRQVGHYWLIGTNNNEWRKQIVQAINFEHDIHHFYKNKWVAVMNPHLDGIDVLMQLIREFMMIEYEDHMFISLDMDIMEQAKYRRFYFEHTRRLWWCSDCVRDGQYLTINYLKYATIELFDLHNASFH